MHRRTTLWILPALLALGGCAMVQPDRSAQEKFWRNLASHCGRAYAGTLTSEDAADADFRGAGMIMHVRQCSDTEIRIPFHVRQADGSWDRSRSWVLSRTASGLRLKHDHRHQDGSPDAVTMYGGDSAPGGSARSQSFPVDASSVAMFMREGLAASVTNVWTIELDRAGTPGARFAYQLRRSTAAGAPADRFFRVEFDAVRAIAPPPAPWGG